VADCRCRYGCLSGNVEAVESRAICRHCKAHDPAALAEREALDVERLRAAVETAEALRFGTGRITPGAWQDVLRAARALAKTPEETR
jgi:hypothetical protein